MKLGRQGVNGAIGKTAKAGHETVRKVELILKKASQDDIEKLNSGKKTINKIYRKVMKEEKKQELMKIKPLTEFPNGVRLIQGDFRTVAKQIKSASVSLVLSDPPYDKANIHLYRDLAKTASRILKQGGSLVVYASTYHLPQVIKNLQSGGLLIYWWCFATKLNHYHGIIDK